MIDDPYKVLGISRDATKDEIKKAYRQKAKEYHPDLHPDDPGAAEKMNEVNEAYDMLNNPEKYQQRQQSAGGGSYGGNPYGNPYGQSQWNQRTYQGGYYGQGNQGGYYGQNGQENGGYGSFGDFGDFWWGFGGRAYAQPPRPTAQPQDAGDIRQAIDFINMKQYSYANQTLNGIVSSRRNARWYYLSSLANHGMGNKILALEQIQKAVQMEPGNSIYQQTLNSLRQMGSSYNEAGQEFQRYAEGINRMCLSFCALQFFCAFCRC